MTILAPCGRNLGSHKNFKLLDKVAGGKGIFPYEKIISSDRIDIKASGNFFDRTDFFRRFKATKCFKSRLQNFILFMEYVKDKKPK